eukprot:6163648-Amphidinium_carterae.1
MKVAQVEGKSCSGKWSDGWGSGETRECDLPPRQFKVLAGAGPQPPQSGGGVEREASKRRGVREGQDKAAEKQRIQGEAPKRATRPMTSGTARQAQRIDESQRKKGYALGQTQKEQAKHRESRAQ